MNKYKVSVMESRNGIYTCVWRELANDVTARSTREALRLAAPITCKLGKPELTRPLPGLTVYEYDNCKYAVEW